MKKQIFLVSMIASSGIFAGIEWVDEHVPTFEDHLPVREEDLIFDDDDEFTLTELYSDSKEEADETTENDYILEESSLEQYMVKEEIVEVEEAEEVREEIVEEEEEEEKEEVEDEVAFELSDFLDEFAEDDLADLDISVEETLPSVADAQLVQIAEVGPFSEFKIEGKAEKSAYVNTFEDDDNPNQEMIYFSPGDNSQVGFYLSSRKVTNEEYEAFVKATHHRPPPHWLGGRITPGQENLPVVNVTYKDAFLYSIWVGKRLPKESELMIAGRASKKACDIVDTMGEWTCTPSGGNNANVKGAPHLTMNSELSRITYHKVFMGTDKSENQILDSNSYNNKTGFRTAISTTQNN